MPGKLVAASSWRSKTIHAARTELVEVPQHAGGGMFKWTKNKAICGQKTWGPHSSNLDDVTCGNCQRILNKEREMADYTSLAVGFDL